MAIAVVRKKTAEIDFLANFNIQGKERKMDKSFQSEGEFGWRCNSPGLLKEIMTNSQCAVLKIPITIFGGILAEVAKRAIELDDPELNMLMMRLALYEHSLPNDPQHNDTYEAAKKALLKYREEEG